MPKKSWLAWRRTDPSARTTSADTRKALPSSSIDIAALRKFNWSQDLGLIVPGYEQGVIVLVCTQSKRYLLLIERDAYHSLNRSDLLERFDTAVTAAMRLKRQGIYVGSAEDNLLVQSRLQQRGTPQETATERVTGAYRNFDVVIGRAIDAGASDVHFEFRNDDQVQVRMRIHGKLRDPDANDQLAQDFRAMIDAVSATYNSRADPNSRSHNHFDSMHHQSCSVPFTYKARKYQLRFQSIKENRGVDIIIRILLNEVVEADILSLEQLGYSTDQIRMLEDAVQRSPGLLIVAGETGSGKSTTLRTLMTYERKSGKKFYSIEDPVEYIQPHVTQIPIQRKAEAFTTGETPFGAAAKVVLRGDPDKVMPGEVRDRETGSFAKSMTETGHQVLSTVHASSCFGVVPRLISQEIGMPLETVAAPRFLSAMVYQKLLPALCPDCKVPCADTFDQETLQVIAALGIETDRVYVEGSGCTRCRGRGTIGQTVVAEVCEITEPLLALIREGRHWQAEAVWRESRHPDFAVADMRGRIAMEHAIHKMACGVIDPRDIESAFYRLGKYRDEMEPTHRHD